MFSSRKILVLGLSLVLSFVFSGEVSDASEQVSAQAPKSNGTAMPKLETLDDGLYLVLRQALTPKALEPLKQNEYSIENDFHLLEPEEREPTVYLVLQSKPFVPLILGTAPKEDTEEISKKPRLQLQLTEEHKKTLEDFTREHMGETVAIVIGGNVVTCHKVKSVITGGALQITRCTKHGCETLFTTLLKSRPKTSL